MATKLTDHQRPILAGLMFVFAAVLSIVAAEIPKDARLAPPGVKTVEAPGIHNMFALGTNVFSGSSPESEESFAALARLGIKTIISVDGGRPAVETARKFGLRYIHLPHGYDGIGANTQLRLVKASQTSDGPVYVHCHHGLHRGPAAAAIICLANSGWTASQAIAWLRMAGTATNYVGLYATIENFRAPPTEVLKLVSSDFPEAAKVSGMIEAMVAIDERWANLKAVRAAGYVTAKESPDVRPVAEATLLWEHFREAQRLSESKKLGDDFLTRLEAAEQSSREAERLLRAFAAAPTDSLRKQLNHAFDAIARSCSSCHKAFRDARSEK